jgi:methionyl-tRNA synthetase
VPGDEEQTIYVWIDALFNYLTYVDDDERRHYWESGATHFIAKDILWFHAAIWPALQMALAKCDGYEWVWGEQVQQNQLVYSHSYWVSESGEKMSKSLGNFLDPAAIDNYVEEFGLDALRYFLATRGPLGTTDSAFSPDLFVEVYNSDLANTFGNSCSRVSNMIGKSFEGKMPPLSGHQRDNVGLHKQIAETPESCVVDYLKAFRSTRLQDAELQAMAIVDEVNSYIDSMQPFKMVKNEDERPEAGTVLHNCAEALRIASVLLWPFIPDKCEAFWSRIGCGHYTEQLKDNGTGDLAEWVKWGPDSGGLKPGTPIEKGEALFPRYQVEKK